MRGGCGEHSCTDSTGCAEVAEVVVYTGDGLTYDSRGLPETQRSDACGVAYDMILGGDTVLELSDTTTAGERSSIRAGVTGRDLRSGEHSGIRAGIMGRAPRSSPETDDVDLRTTSPVWVRRPFDNTVPGATTGGFALQV